MDVLGWIPVIYLFMDQLDPISNLTSNFIDKIASQIGSSAPLPKWKRIGSHFWQMIVLLYEPTAQITMVTY